MSTLRHAKAHLGVLSCLATLLLSVGVSAAAEDEQLTVFPTSARGAQARTFFVYQLDRAVPLEDSVTIVNKTDDELTIDLYATDAATTTDGAFAPQNRDDEQTGIGVWLVLDETELTIPAGDDVRVPFTLEVPDGTDPGDYAGVIVALVQGGGELADPEGGFSLDVRTGVGARVYARVGGTVRTALAVSAIGLDPARSIGTSLGGSSTAELEYTITNTGTARTVPIVSAEVAGPFGTGETVLADRTLPELLPGGSITITEEIDRVWPSFVVTATVTATAPGGEAATTATGRTVFVPWILAGIMVVVGAELVRRLGWRRSKQHASGAQVEQGAAA